MKDNQYNISIAGFDHNIVIEKATGEISLVQSMDRALTTSQIFASVNCAMQDFLTIRAGQGLSFHGNIKIVDGSIELYTLFGVLSARGSLTAKQIKLLAIEGSLDISATLDAYSLVTYAKTESYIHDTIINAIQFLAQTVGHYIQARSNVNTSKTVIISESSDVMLIASRMQSTILEVTSGRTIRVDESSMRATDQAYRGDNVHVTDSNISGQSSSFQSQQDIGIVKSNISVEQVTNIAGEDLRVIGSNVASRKMKNVAGRDIRVDESSMRATDQAYRGDNIHVTDSNISGQSSSFQSQQDIGIDRSNIIGKQATHQAGKDIRVDESNIQVTDQAYRGDNVYVTDSNISGQSSSFQSQQDIGIVRSSIIDEQITNQAGRDLRVTDLYLYIILLHLYRIHTIKKP
ncbi:DUF3737 family protein [Candidatus Tisiphia endosymbiont of Stenodema calcarata]|uniref:DUF3737 family protein n=1 Tax=Candidatus Tisiphia endosymbiont of Stenodema calcarata TaxID=3139337 RepID=UPI003CCA9505